MKLPPLLSERPRTHQVVVALVIPLIYGALTGYVLGTSKALYALLSILAAIGGVGAGFDHLGAAAGAKRGVLGGALFGGAILVVHAITGDAKTKLPDPPILLVVATVVLGALLGAAGGYLRQRAEARRAA